MAANPFTSAGGNLSGFARDVVPVTPNNDADISAGAAAVAIICKGDAGNVVVVTVDGGTRTYPIAVGEVLPVGITRVRATDTTATGIWAFLV
jgi:hypothetical protein